MKITPRKKRLIEFVNAYTRLHGFSPSIPEIAENLKRAQSTIHQHLKELEAGGYLNRRKNQTRSIAVNQQERMVSIPLLGTIAAGEPIQVFEEERESIAVPQSKLPKFGEIYALRVEGDSMIDEGVSNGDTILVKRQQTAENGQKIVALLDGNEATLKTFYKERGQIRLQPANKNFKPIIVKNRDISIQGVLFETIKKQDEATDNLITPLASQRLRSLNIIPLKSVSNPNSIHGIYPYRGKISSIDAASVVSQLKPGLLLDPFCGSGTILYEASRAGINSIGIDNNPLAAWIARGKIASLDGKNYFDEARKIIAKAQNQKITKTLTPLVKKGFHEKTAYEIFSTAKYFDEMSDFVRACFLGTIALAARGCNQYKWTSSSVGKDIQPKKYICFYEKFINKIKKHTYSISSEKKSIVHLKDARKLGNLIEKNSVDYVFTSPPYFDGLDYTSYYGRIIYDILGEDYKEIKKELIQTTATYARDMQQVLAELVKVTKKDGLIIFVVGDKKIKNEVINGGQFFSNLLKHKPNLVIERNYSGTSSQIFDQLNKTDRREQIVIWDKSTWK